MAQAKKAIQEDPLVIQAAVAGDRAAVTKLLSDNYERTLRYIANKYFKRHTEAAHDVLQETCLRAFKSIKNFRGESAFSTWFTQIATHVAFNVLADDKERQSYSVDNQDDDEDLSLAEARMYRSGHISPDDPVKVVQCRQAVEKINRKIARGSLDPAIVDGLNMTISSVLGGASYQEIADEHEVPIGTVRSRIFRAREFLQTHSLD